MCSYCGCRALTEIGDLSREHEALVNALGDVRRALHAVSGAPVSGDTDAAVAALATLLRAHTDREEGGLFVELAANPDFAAHREELLGDHRVVEQLLARLRAGDLPAFDSLEHDLRRHIDREENGLFPAVAVSLDWDGWERIAQRRGAGPNGTTGAPSTGASWVA